MPPDNFQEWGDQIFLKRIFIVIIIIFVIILCSIIIVTIAADKDDEISKNFWGCAKKVFKSSIFVSVFQRRSGHYLLYGRIETYKLHESVYISFLDAQIKGTEYSF